jgi:hypothetical protein
VVDGHRLLSHAAAVAVELHDSSRALLVGSVASARSARGHGLASAVIDYVIERARDEGNDSVILWSELHGFFGRFGFVPAGSQYCLPVRARPHSWPPGTRVRPASPADLPKLLELHRHKPLAVRRTPDDLATLLAARPMTTSVLTRGGDLVAYACLGKGADFTGWWHELGGHDLDALRLIEAVTHAIGMPSAMVLVPPYRTDLRQALDPRAAPQPAALRLALTPRGAGALFVDGLDSI